MKKIICLLLAVFGGLLANPIDPSFMFSELKFDDQNNWQLEIHSFKPDVVNEIDSVIISSSTGKSKVKNTVFSTGNTSFYTVQNNNQSLEKNLTLNSTKDTIKITTHFKNSYVGYDIFIFGAGSDYPVENTDGSIANFFYDWFGGQAHTLGIGYNLTPSLGSPNDSTGNICILYGKVLDKNGNPISNANYYINSWPMFLTTDSDGNYRIRLLAKGYNFTNLNFGSNLIPLTTPINLVMNPGYTYNRDFILDMVGINEQPFAVKSSTLLYNYPNPFNNQTAIYYEVPEGLKYKNATIRISNIKGEAVAVLAANQKSGSVYWNADHHSAGMYIYQLLIDGKAVKSGEMVLLK